MRVISTSDSIRVGACIVHSMEKSIKIASYDTRTVQYTRQLMGVDRHALVPRMRYGLAVLKRAMQTILMNSLRDRQMLLY